MSGVVILTALPPAPLDSVISSIATSVGASQSQFTSTLLNTDHTTNSLPRQLLKLPQAGSRDRNQAQTHKKQQSLREEGAQDGHRVLDPHNVESALRRQ